MMMELNQHISRFKKINDAREIWSIEMITHAHFPYLATSKSKVLSGCFISDFEGRSDALRELACTFYGSGFQPKVKQCGICLKKSSSLWRNGPWGNNTLCNTHGIWFQRDEDTNFFIEKVRDTMEDAKNKLANKKQKHKHI